MSVPEWAVSLPPDLQSAEIVKNTPDLPTVVKRLIDLDRYKGSSLALPKDGDEASAKAFAEAVSKRGFIAGEVPADPSGYDAPVDVSNLGLDDAWKTSRLAEYHALGLTKAQARAAMSREVGAMEAAVKGITAKHGADAMKAIQKASARYNINNDPASILNLLLEIGTNMTEDNTQPGGGAPSGMSLTDIDAKMADLNDQLRKLPDGDPRAQKLIEEKFGLMKSRAAAISGDLSNLDVTFDQAAKAISRGR